MIWCFLNSIDFEGQFLIVESFFEETLNQEKLENQPNFDLQKFVCAF